MVRHTVRDITISDIYMRSCHEGKISPQESCVQGKVYVDDMYQKDILVIKLVLSYPLCKLNYSDNSRKLFTNNYFLCLNT